MWRKRVRDLLEKVPKWLQLIFAICALIAMLWKGGSFLWSSASKFDTLQKTATVVVEKDQSQDWSIAQLIILQSERNDSLAKRINNLEKVMCMNLPHNQLVLIDVKCP